MNGQRILVGCAVAGLLATAHSTANEPANSAMVSTPVYTDDGALERPDDFRNWVFVGASLGLNYSPSRAEYGKQLFHNVYLNRPAYEHYRRTGNFPDQTMLAMAVYRSAQKADADLPLQGAYEGDFVSLEVAVKDAQRFEDGWAYFDFSGGESEKRTARPFAREKCFDCHAEHAATDNVFVQFYPVLRETTPGRGQRN